MTLNVKQKTMIGLVSLILVAGTIGFGISQSLIQRMFTGSVTISVIGDIALLDETGQPLGTVEWGTLNPEQVATKTIIIKNTGNTQLDITGNRIDSNNEITVEYRNPDGSAFSGNSLKGLNPGDEITIVIAIWSAETALGEYQIQILFEAVTVTT